MTSCINSNKARVYYSVYEEQASNNCWAFLGKGLCNDKNYIYLACGNNPSFRTATTNACPENGQYAKPIIDGRELTTEFEQGLDSATARYELVSKEDINSYLAQGYIQDGTENCDNCFSCDLRPEQYFDIEKLPFIQYISVEVGDSPNKLNFYRISTLTSTGTPNKDLIKTIQSDEGCPEPKYEIECNPEDKCPPGTCECEISGKICCYDPITGVVIDEKEFGNGSSGGGGAGGGF